MTDDDGWSTPSLCETPPVSRRPVDRLLDEGGTAELTEMLLKEHRQRKRKAKPDARRSASLSTEPQRGATLHEPGASVLAGDEHPRPPRVSSRFSGRFHSDTVLECDDGLYPPTAATIAAGMAVVGGPLRYPLTPATIAAGQATVG